MDVELGALDSEHRASRSRILALEVKVQNLVDIEEKLLALEAKLEDYLSLEWDIKPKRKRKQPTKSGAAKQRRRKESESSEESL